MFVLHGIGVRIFDRFACGDCLGRGRDPKPKSVEELILERMGQLQSRLDASRAELAAKNERAAAAILFKL